MQLNLQIPRVNQIEATFAIAGRALAHGFQRWTYVMIGCTVVDVGVWKGFVVSEPSSFVLAEQATKTKHTTVSVIKYN